MTLRRGAVPAWFERTVRRELGRGDRLDDVVQIIVAVAVVVAGVVAAALVRRRDAGQMARGKRWSVPAQLDRNDFDDPGADRLVVVFSSETCDACASTWERTLGLVGSLPGTVAERVSFQQRPDLHERYGIDAVPTLVVADREGVVQRSFVGPPGEAELNEALGPGAETPAS